VSDTGTGISNALLNRIFDPFFSTKEVNNGSGMGLSVVHGLTHDAGGHISINSNENEGASISILLPLPVTSSLPEIDTENTDINISHRHISGQKVMVVDDEHMITSMLSELLSMYGAEVSTFNNSKIALEHFTKAPTDIDMVITDETMPELSGLDMSRHMLNVRPQLPIVICTGHSEYVNPNIAEQSGITAFMLKPLDLEKLLDTVDEIASQKKQPH
jgi:CheY-like chemotaxis protein